jgi:nitrate reductase NapA
MTDEAAGLERREFLEILAGLGVTGAGAVVTWRALEWTLPPSSADSWHRSVCRFCGTGCGIRVGMRDGAITDIRGDESAHNKGVICVKGSMLRALPLIPDRLTTPKIRNNGRLVDASWDDAMALVAATFREAIDTHGPDSVAFYGSGQLFTEESYTANKLFRAGIRTNNVDGNPRLCMASAAFGYTQVFGKDEPPGSYEDIDYADCIFLMGANPFECHPPIFERIQQRRRAHPDLAIICVDPRRTLTAERSTHHLAVTPGTDLLLLNAMAHVMVMDGLVDHAFIDAHVRFDSGTGPVDLAAFRQFLGNYSPAAVEGRVGVPATMIREIAYRFARSKGTVSLWTMGVNQRTQGTFLNNMLNGLHLITGQICRPGATPFSLTGQPNACGGVRDTGSLAHALPNGRLVANPTHRQQMEQLWNVAPGTLSATPGLDAVPLFQAMEDGRVKAALVMCTNPAHSMPNAARYRAAMEKAFLVVSEIVADSETAKVADVLLPAALWVEKQGVLGQGERRYQLVDKLLDPPGQARSDLAILVDLAERLGHGTLISARTPQAVWDEWRTISAASPYNFKGITYDRLRREGGLQWPCPDESHPGTVRRYVAGQDPNVAPGRQIDFYGQHDKRAVVFLRPYTPAPEQRSDEFPFYLTTGRVLEQWHTGTMTQRIPQLRDAAGEARFELNEADASRLGVATSDPIEVRSRFGSVTGRAVISPASPPGVVFAAFYDAALLVNGVVTDAVDPISKQPEYKVTAVSLRRQDGA